MVEYFDRYNWNAQLFQTPEELNEALVSFAIKGKRIKAIHTIGMARNMEPWAHILAMRNALAGVGISYADIDSGKYSGIDQTLLPCEVKICEPVVVVFHDDSTLEIKPDGSDGLRMSINQISSSVVDGLNHSNFDSSRFFERVIGSTIQDIQTIRRTTTRNNCTSDHSEERVGVTWQFWMEGEFGLFFRRSWDGWFAFGMTVQNHFMELGNETAKIDYATMKKAANHVRQIPIVEGHDGSSYFWIMPVRHVDPLEDNRERIEKCRDQEISIEENDIGEFLYYFLDQYFDGNYPYGDARDEYGGSVFEWNLEYNIYTYTTIRKMLDNIEKCSILLKTDFYNEEIAELKKRFHYYTFDPDENCYQKNLTEAEREKLIRDNIELVIDFYDRFVRRMRKMMLAADDYELISFMGP